MARIDSPHAVAFTKTCTHDTRRRRTAGSRGSRRAGPASSAPPPVHTVWALLRPEADDGDAEQHEDKQEQEEQENKEPQQDEAPQQG